MKKWHMIIDVVKCEDCNNCFLACKDEHVDNEWKGYSNPQPRHGHKWINISRKERGSFPIIDVAYRPEPCMHCEEAPCIKASGGAAYKRQDGIVIIDSVKSKGRKDIVDSCPYKAISWNEEHNVPQKCTMCAHLLDDGWKEPRCVQACPTGALKMVSVEDAEWKRMIENEGLEALNPGFKTLPGVYYKNMYRFEKCFIAGSVEVSGNGLTDCAEGAKVTLLKNGQKTDESVTDNYGDFKFDRLGENSGIYTLSIALKGYETKTLEVELKESINIGSIRL